MDNAVSGYLSSFYDNYDICESICVISVYIVDIY